jgi:glutamate synthase (NADPH/NADH) small chain
MCCLECAKPACQSGCPVNVNVREFVRLVGEGDYLAAAKIREDNVLPAITGRVCHQETQCEGCCLLGEKAEPLGLGAADESGRRAPVPVPGSEFELPI